jgi:hypothetical protein
MLHFFKSMLTVVSLAIIAAHACINRNVGSSHEVVQSFASGDAVLKAVMLIL